MVLSIIIVNFRVKYFLELCLHSVQKAVGGLDAEIIVVDNASGDDSLDYLRPRFPGIRFIANTENRGFGRACNQALAEAGGEYVLFLNPDTILPEDFATRCLAFLAETPGIGGLGVRMVDGSGHFLKESRRGFPTPWVGFCRLSGLAALFPRSRFFSMYYLGHLAADRAHPAPVLSGACMWVRRAILDKVGGFDEQFFLYAEDIDLSFRIEKAGYTNYYYPGVTIVHFKGESTLKDIRYVRQFYRAMRQFRRKHFDKVLPAFLDIGVQAAIQLRAGIAAAIGVFRRGAEAGDKGGSGKGARSIAGDNGVSDGKSDSGRNVGPAIRTCLRGDGAEMQRVKALLAASGERTIVEQEQEAGEVILCEGAGFSFKESVAILERVGKEGRIPVKFHAGGSGSAVGSPDRHGRGEALVF